MASENGTGAQSRRLAESGVAKAREAYEAYAEAGERVVNAFEASAAQTLSGMRALAESTRVAMRPASGGADTGQPGMGERGFDAFEAAATRTWAGMREIAQRMLIASDTNVRATLDCAEKLAQATDASAFVAVQAQFFKEQSERLTQQMVDIQQTTDRVARDIAPAQPDAP